MKSSRQVVILLSAVLLFSLAAGAVAETAENEANECVCIVYFTGVGCPHCAVSDPVVLGDLPPKYNGSLVVIEYEIYQTPENAQVFSKYQEECDAALGVPQVVFSRGCYILGDRDIKQSIESEIDFRMTEGCECQFSTDPVKFEEMDFNSLPGKPKIWAGDRILMRTGTGDVSHDLLRGLLLSENISLAVESVSEAQKTEPESVPLSGSNVKFDNAARIGGWTIQWNEPNTRPVDDGRITDRGILYYLPGLNKVSNIIVVLAVIILVSMLISNYISKRKEVKK